MMTREEAIKKITSKHCTYTDDAINCEYCERVSEVVTLVYDEFFKILIDNMQKPQFIK